MSIDQRETSDSIDLQAIHRRCSAAWCKSWFEEMDKVKPSPPSSRQFWDESAERFTFLIFALATLVYTNNSSITLSET